MLKNILILSLMIFIAFIVSAQGPSRSVFFNQGTFQEDGSLYSNPPAPTYGVYSRNPEAGAVTISNPLSGVAEDLPGLIGYLLRIARILASAIAVLVIVYGAYQILFAAGNPVQFQKGIKTIVYAIIGLAVILLGDIIVSILREIVR